jgi:hypothetical protein
LVDGKEASGVFSETVTLYSEVDNVAGAMATLQEYVEWKEGRRYQQDSRY